MIRRRARIEPSARPIVRREETCKGVEGAPYVYDSPRLRLFVLDALVVYVIDGVLHRLNLFGILVGNLEC